MGVGQVEKCTPESYCTHMLRRLECSPVKGFHPVYILRTNYEGGMLIGIGYRKKDADYPLMLNFCPWCGESLQWWSERMAERDT